MRHKVIPYGTLIGNIIVLEMIQNPNTKNIVYNYKCECGNISKTRPGRLTPSLICRKCRAKIGTKFSPCTTKKSIDSPFYRGTKNITGNYFSRIKKSARIRGFDFSISISYIQNLLELQNYKCKISGVDIVMDPVGVASKDYKNTASLDRIDSSKGYVEGNVQWVHKDLNKMKMDMEEKLFFHWCSVIHEHQTGAAVSAMCNSSKHKSSF